MGLRLLDPTCTIVPVSNPPCFSHLFLAMSGSKKKRNASALASGSRKKPPMHSGRWTPEEEQYVEGMIAEFNAGLLPIAEGTTLRSFLAKMRSNSMVCFRLPTRISTSNVEASRSRTATSPSRVASENDEISAASTRQSFGSAPLSAPPSSNDYRYSPGCR